MVVTIAMKFVSILKRLKKRRTTSLCKNRGDDKACREKASERSQAEESDVVAAYVETAAAREASIPRSLV